MTSRCPLGPATSARRRWVFWAVGLALFGALGPGAAAATTTTRTTLGPPGTAAGQPAPPGVDSLAAVSCADAKHCIAVGLGTSGPAIIATTDGGREWQDQAVPTGVTSLAGVSCPTATHCLAVGQGLSGSTQVAVVISTVDGGRVWILTGGPAGAISLSQVTCPAVDQCQTLGTDGQNSWSAATADGGTFWSRGAILPAGFGAPGQLSCPDLDHCVVAGYTPTTPGQAAGALASTVDGGTTWTAATLPSGTGLVHSVSCPTDTSCTAVGTTATADSAVTAGAGLLLITSDGGLTWATDPPPSGLGDGFSISCPTTRNCVAVGSRWLPTKPPTPTGAALATDTAGQQWRPPAVSYLPTALVAVDCPTAANCVAVGGDEIARLKVPVPPVKPKPPVTVPTGANR